MNTKELAEFLRTTQGAVRMMRVRGTGPKGFRVGRNTLYRRADIEAWLTARQITDQYA